MRILIVEDEQKLAEVIKARLEKEIARCEGMLSNERFISKAPEAKVQAEKDKLETYKQMMEQVKERLEGLKSKLA